MFILYATVHSGRGARFVSSDYMRDHVFRMRHPDLEALFQKWQVPPSLSLSLSLSLSTFFRPMTAFVSAASGIHRPRRPTDAAIAGGPPGCGPVPRPTRCDRLGLFQNLTHASPVRVVQGGDPDVVDVAWHVPYDDGKPRETCQPPDTWLCLQPSLATTLLEHVRRRQSH